MRPVFAVAGAIGLVAFGWAIAKHAQEVASGADNSSYMNAARLFLGGKIREELRLPPGFAHSQFRPWLFTPLGFSPAPDGRQLVPFYPPGLSVLQAVLALPTGSVEKGARATNVLSGFLLLWLTYRLGRALGLARPAAAAAVAILAVNPVTVRFFTWNMSDGPATTWAVAAVYFAVKGTRKTAYAAASGFFFALGLATRPTNALLALAILAVLWKRWRALAAWVAGAAPVLVPFFWYNHVQYGAFWRTGYGEIIREFKLRYFPPTLLHYGYWFVRFFSPLAAVFLAGHLLRTARRQHPHLVLASWWLPFLVFYGFYKYTNDAWWYLRFVLPAFPALILGSVAGLSAGAKAFALGLPKRASRVITGAALVVVVSAGWFWTAKLQVLRLINDETIYRRGVQWVCAQTPATSVLFATQLSGAVYFYSSRAIVRHDLATDEELRRLLQTAEAHHLPAYLALFDDEARVFVRRNPGAAEPLGNLDRLSLFRVPAEAWQLIGKPAAPPPPRRPSVVPEPVAP